MSTPYWQLLQDPRWQRLRLEVMERAEFRCEWCEATDKTLHVHHTYYEKNLKPWEYPPESLRCLCKNCHEETERVLGQIKRKLGSLELLQLQQILGYVDGLALSNEERISGDSDYAQGLSDAMSIFYPVMYMQLRNMLRPDGLSMMVLDTDAESLRELSRRWQERTTGLLLDITENEGYGKQQNETTEG